MYLNPNPDNRVIIKRTHIFQERGYFEKLMNTIAKDPFQIYLFKRGCQNALK